MNLLQEEVPAIQREPRILNVIQYPNDTLRQVSALVTSNIAQDEQLQQFLDDMVATLQAYHAVGLAAIQVGVPMRVLVVQDEALQPIKVINPVIKEVDGWQFNSEGCLSLPGLFLRVRRPEEVVVQYFNELGELKTTSNAGLLARAIVHEMDHLEGKMFFDSLSTIEKSNALRKFKHLKRKFKAASLGA